MAKIYETTYTAVARQVVRSQDINALQADLVTAFNKLGTEAPAGSTGVSSEFHVADATVADSAVTKRQHDAGVSAVSASAVTATEQVALTEAQVVLASDQVTLASDQVTLASDQVTLASDQVTLASDQAVIATDQAVIATDQATAASGVLANTYTRDEADIRYTASAGFNPFTSADETKLNAIPTFAIGDTGPAGGLVFYVDHTGMHGLEAALVDQHAGLAWYNTANNATWARGSGIGAGLINTLIILSEPTGSSAAERSQGASGICADYVLNNFADFHLPSLYELTLMYTTLHANNLGGFTSANYWSSTENTFPGNESTSAKIVRFSDGSSSVYSKSSPLRVRACRHF